MKSLIDFNEVKKFITERRRMLIDHFCGYRWESSELSIDDVIVETKITKELEVIFREIRALAPSGDDMTRVNNAVIALANFTKTHDDVVAGSDYYKHVKTIADYLGLTLPNKDSEDQGHNE